MRTLENKIKTSLIISIISIPIIVALTGLMWKSGIFNFGTNLSQLNFKELISEVYINVIPVMLIDYLVIGTYIYYSWYKKIKTNGIIYVETLVKKIKKELVIGYGILMIVMIASPLVPKYASLFVPLAIMILIPITIFVLLMNTK